MPRTAALLVRIAGPGLLIFLSACNNAKPAASAPGHEVAPAAPALTAPAHTVPTDPPASTSAATSCGGAEPGSCCAGQQHQGQGDSACGQGSCAGDHAASCGAAQRDALPADDDSIVALTRIADPSQVCMVRNHFMGRPQLAVQAEGSTYYGCCAGCANRLLQDARARQAIDPISHNPVDKGLAVLGKTARGAVLYFENETNLAMFRATMQ